jgi:hypothetical protein
LCHLSRTNTRRATSRASSQACSTLHQYKNLDSDVLQFNISREIVEIVIGDLLSLPEVELASAETENDDEHIADRNRKVARLKKNALACS